VTRYGSEIRLVLQRNIDIHRAELNVQAFGLIMAFVDSIKSIMPDQVYRRGGQIGAQSFLYQDEPAWRDPYELYLSGAGIISGRWVAKPKRE